ncbi:Barstar, RNAse (barnase) inhibitor [Actinokineospora alba]|uniref:Barstar, RNAse (Barnase) inhibitor n=1 Tax=Actinokineospora alba TaxID=504798 RepID=A0A1H0K830_9PSEU|nr:barstar family protein [Actinokineospora alba]TDP68008.1 RNAse (barnase) inhibitor barstar [Actinokineospora alba]SDH90619.1 Barstar, RNAse (barnase) inhibitor [Actinokineospora alba]SDO52047.1 Barstar, RNAse (barnase) inhibitor [Actinokineospora alba]
MIEHVLDGSGVRSKRTMYTAIAKTLSFPDWFGHNLDGLYDCLTDLSWLPKGEHVLIWTHSEVLAKADPSGYRAIREVLDDAVEGATDPSRTLSVVLAKPQS